MPILPTPHARRRPPPVRRPASLLLRLDAPAL
uniref:Uncharacterized protein n=1 Tax=Arundo donax TaxID=35708 RepID=A0A0A9D993_ARUDO